MLLVYASDLASFIDPASIEADDDAELADLLARLLLVVVERRLRRNLSRGYRPREALLTRVRGRIDWLRTVSGDELRKGRVACRFEELTFDTPRDRLVRAALEVMSGRVTDALLAHRCRGLARDLDRLGVSAGRPSRADLTREQVGRHDADDRLMVSVALLALDVVLPSEVAGPTSAQALARDERLLRRIFERAVAGFYRHELDRRDGWRVFSQRSLAWPAEDPTPGLSVLLPGMVCDVVLERGERRIVLDTKFTRILEARQHGGEGLKSSHLYQLYSYLRSQAGQGDARADTASGLLLHPSLDRRVDESVTLHSHRVRFATVNLTSRPAERRQRLLALALELM